MGIILHPILEYIMFPKERITEFFSEPIYNSPVFQVGLDIPLTYHTAEWIVGGTRNEALSNPSKMPGRAFNTSRSVCNSIRTTLARASTLPTLWLSWVNTDLR